MISDDIDHNHHVFVELSRSNDIDKGSFSCVLKFFNYFNVVLIVVIIIISFIVIIKFILIFVSSTIIIS